MEDVKQVCKVGDTVNDVAEGRNAGATLPCPRPVICSPLLLLIVLGLLLLHLLLLVRHVLRLVQPVIFVLLHLFLLRTCRRRSSNCLLLPPQPQPSPYARLHQNNRYSAHRIARNSGSGCLQAAAS